MFPDARTLRALGLMDVELKNYKNCILPPQSGHSNKSKPKARLIGSAHAPDDARRERTASWFVTSAGLRRYTTISARSFFRWPLPHARRAYGKCRSRCRGCVYGGGVEGSFRELSPRTIGRAPRVRWVVLERGRRRRLRAGARNLTLAGGNRIQAAL